MGNLAFNNMRRGIIDNAAEKQFRIFHNTAWNNNDQEFWVQEGVHILRNNLAHGSGVSIVDGADDQNNSWNLNTGDPQFASTDPSSNEFLWLSQGSPAIDAGTEVDADWPTQGSAPDLGAFERGAETDAWC